MTLSKTGCIVCHGPLWQEDAADAAFVSEAFCSDECRDVWDVESALDPPVLLPFQGLVSDVRCYNRVLTKAEVASIHEYGRKKAEE